jgi:3-hydroxybutyryl-CoA dehydrogenase
MLHVMNGEIKKLGVVGLGVMGFDIAFLYAMKGFYTVTYDTSRRVMESLKDRRDDTIERLKRRNRISETETENVRRLLIPAAELANLAQADLITEAVLENAQTKLVVYQTLKASSFQGILTTNTSSLTRATLMASEPYDRSKFALTHFFNPVLYTWMVEVVRGDMEDRRFTAMLSFLKALRRDPIETTDISGFVSNSILMPYAVTALHLLECGARIEEVDQTAKNMGFLPPFISLDSWKPSIVEDVTRVMFELRGDSFLRSSTLLSVLAGGNPKFYLDQKPNPEIYRHAKASSASCSEVSIRRALKASIWASAARTVELGESPATVDFIATQGIRIPRPPLREIDSLGAGNVLRELTAIYQEMPSIPLTPPALLAAMAGDRENFYKGDQLNPWLLSHVRQ